MWFKLSVIIIVFAVVSSSADIHTYISSSLFEHLSADANFSSPLGTSENTNLTSLYDIRIYPLNNITADASRELLRNDIFNEMFEDTAELVATFLVVVDDDDNDTLPINLDDVTKDLESEDLTVEKLIKNGTIHFFKIDHNLIDTSIDDNDNDGISNNTGMKINNEELNNTHVEHAKVRRKRSFGFMRRMMGYGRNRCNTGCCTGCCTSCCGCCCQQQQQPRPRPRPAPQPKVYAVTLYYTVQTVQMPQSSGCSPCTCQPCGCNPCG